MDYYFGPNKVYPKLEAIRAVNGHLLAHGPVTWTNVGFLINVPVGEGIIYDMGFTFTKAHLHGSVMNSCGAQPSLWSPPS